MKKIIHKGDDSGLFGYEPFKKFIEELNGVQSVYTSESLIFPHHPLVYHITPQGVAIRYFSWKMNADTRVSVTLFGEKKGIGEVEKIILEEANNYSR